MPSTKIYDGNGEHIGTIVSDPGNSTWVALDTESLEEFGQFKTRNEAIDAVFKAAGRQRREGCEP